ncbi:YjfK family protein [Thaumasiovibrio sp. DFM-14]|uniref:YjfK family protein n=1 Tax=Thaumasiovibrio sp. DFM-14 TaxID=3384792 RepID=UPI00399F385D
MFDWFKKKSASDNAASVSPPPEVLGLYLGGAFELDPLKLKLIEPELIIEGASQTQLIQAVGVVQLDENTRLVRYYTDDDGFIQILQHGTEDADISEVKLFYFYETKSVDTSSQWQQWLDNDIVNDSWQLEGHHFDKVWDNIKPVAMTEKTWSASNNITETDQFAMLYEREVNSNLFESLIVAGEEKIQQGQAERCVVISTGFALSPTDFKLIA